MQDRTIQVGFIGVGNFITAHHLPNAQKNPGIHIRALCDLDEKRLRKQRGRFPCDYVTTDYRKLLADRDIDLVIIGTRHDQHAAISVAAMRAGKDVLCEKPMSHDRRGMRRVVETQRATGCRCVIGHNRRFAPAMLDAKKLIAKRRRPFVVSYRIVDDAALWPAWPFDPENGGKLLSECCHVFDLLAWLLDAEPVRIYAAGGLADNNVVTIDYSDGSVASVVSGGLGSAEYPKELLEVFCGSATVAVDHFLQLKVNGIPGEQDRFYPFASESWRHVTGRNDAEGYRERMKVWRKNILPADFKRRYYGNLPAVDKGHYNELDLLAAAIREGRPAEANAVDAARATVCSFKAIESLRSGRPVAIAPRDYFAGPRPLKGTR